VFTQCFILGRMETNANDPVTVYTLIEGEKKFIEPLTKREYFAGLAMQGLLSNLSDLRYIGFKDSELPEFALLQADELIKQLNETKQ